MSNGRPRTCCGTFRAYHPGPSVVALCQIPETVHPLDLFAFINCEGYRLDELNPPHAIGISGNKSVVALLVFPEDGVCPLPLEFGRRAGRESFQQRSYKPGIGQPLFGHDGEQADRLPRGIAQPDSGIALCALGRKLGIAGKCLRRVLPARAHSVQQHPAGRRTRKPLFKILGFAILPVNGNGPDLVLVRSRQLAYIDTVGTERIGQVSDQGIEEVLPESGGKPFRHLQHAPALSRFRPGQRLSTRPSLFRHRKPSLKRMQAGARGNCPFPNPPVCNLIGLQTRQVLFLVLNIDQGPHPALMESAP